MRAWCPQGAGVQEGREEARSEAGKQVSQHKEGLECWAKEFGLWTYLGHREPLGGSVSRESLHFKLSLEQGGGWMTGGCGVTGAS